MKIENTIEIIEREKVGQKQEKHIIVSVARVRKVIATTLIMHLIQNDIIRKPYNMRSSFSGKTLIISL